LVNFKSSSEQDGPSMVVGCLFEFSPTARRCCFAEEPGILAYYYRFCQLCCSSVKSNPV